MSIIKTILQVIFPARAARTQKYIHLEEAVKVSQTRLSDAIEALRVQAERERGFNQQLVEQLKSGMKE